MKKSNKKLLIIGHARHGKDTTAELLKELYGYTFESSSVAASKIFLFETLKGKYNYDTIEECFEDRINHRAEWHTLIANYNTPNKAALAAKILETSDIYVGMRSDVECIECLNQGIFNLIIGVWDYRKDLEHKGSFDINIWERSDIIIPNCGTLADLRQKIILLAPLFV